MIYDDDEIERILSGPTGAPYVPSVDDPEILAETVVRVDLGAELGMLELYIDDRPDLALAGEERQVLFRFPDGGNLEPSEAEKVWLDIRVRHLELYLSGMRKAIDRARAMGVLPPAARSERTP